MTLSSTSTTHLLLDQGDASSMEVSTMSRNRVKPQVTPE